MARYLGIDYGKARIGIAISDEYGKIALPLMTLSKKPFSELFKDLHKILQEYQPIREIIVGLPLLLSGKESEMAKEVRDFAEKLRDALGLSIIFWDERLTSLQAERMLKQQSISRKKRVGKTDQLSAMLILQSYLDVKK
jgi:putative Holliday junction resolvase